MRSSFHRVTAPLASPFRFARGTQERVGLVELSIGTDGMTGHGEAAPLEHLAETADDVCDFLALAADELGQDPFALSAIERRLDRLAGPAAGRAAVDAALHDLCGKLVGLPIWRLLGLERAGPPTMYSIGIGPPEQMGARAGDAAGRFKMLKIKVGAGDGLDLERVEAVRSSCGVPIAVDANGEWSLEKALALLPALADLDVVLVEQPLAVRHPGAGLLKQWSPIPIYLDEECRTSHDVAGAARRAHGINVKLMKTGGIREALRTIHAARALKLGVMVGCGMESTLGIAAACQIASLADYVDLDGNLMLAGDRWSGVELADGLQLPSHEPGLGVREALPDTG